MTILITGATGTVGGAVARRLAALGVEFDIGARKPEAARGLGARRVRHLDLDAPDTWGQAFAGVDRLFLVGPMGADLGSRTAAIAEVARDAGVTFILRLSAFGANPTGSFPLSIQHGLADNALAHSGVSWTVLRPTFFQDNLVTYQGDAVRGSGAFYGASGTGATAYVSSRDIGRAAAAILTRPGPHHGKRYVLTGPEALSDDQVAGLASEITGRQIRYVDVGLDGYEKNLRDGGSPDWIARSMVALERLKRDGLTGGVSRDLVEITGEPGEAYRAFLERNRNQLQAAG